MINYFFTCRFLGKIVVSPEFRPAEHEVVWRHWLLQRLLPLLQQEDLVRDHAVAEPAHISQIRLRPMFKYI